MKHLEAFVILKLLTSVFVLFYGLLYTSTDKNISFGNAVRREYLKRKKYIHRVEQPFGVNIFDQGGSLSQIICKCLSNTWVVGCLT